MITIGSFFLRCDGSCFKISGCRLSCRSCWPLMLSTFLRFIRCLTLISRSASSWLSCSPLRTLSSVRSQDLLIPCQFFFLRCRLIVWWFYGISRSSFTIFYCSWGHLVTSEFAVNIFCTLIGCDKRFSWSAFSFNLDRNICTRCVSSRRYCTWCVFDMHSRTWRAY